MKTQRSGEEYSASTAMEV